MGTFHQLATVETIVKNSIRYDLTFTDREYELIVAAGDKPSPERLKALIIAEARSTLRRMIDVVDQERNASFKSASSPTRAAKTLPVREHQRKLVLKRNTRTRKPNHADHSAVQVEE
jgi:hypothetical protein